MEVISALVGLAISSFLLVGLNLYNHFLMLQKMKIRYRKMMKMMIIRHENYDGD